MLHYVVAFLPGVCLLLSEVMPFVKSTKANGILHAIYLALTKAEELADAANAKAEQPK